MTPALLSGEVLTLYAAEEFSLSVLALFFSFPRFPFYILSLRVSHCPPLYSPPPLCSLTSPNPSCPSLRSRPPSLATFICILLGELLFFFG